MPKSFNEGVVITFGNQKGGVGKTISASLFANYIHSNYNDKLSILVCDCDDLQSSLSAIRDFEVKNNPDLNKEVLYNLLQISSLNFPQQVDMFKSEYDIILVDLPGNLKQPGVIQCYACVDVMYIPTQPSFLDIDSTLKFINLMKDEIISLREKYDLETDFYTYLSRVDVNNRDFKNIYNDRASYGINFLDSFIPESKVQFQRNISTTKEYTSGKYDDYSDFCEDVLSKIVEFNKHRDN